MSRTALLTVGMLVIPSGLADAAVAASAEPATYEINLVSVTPPRLVVTAKLPIDGNTLEMESTRPAGIPELDAGGWPALVSSIRVATASGAPIALTKSGKHAWTLAEPRTGWLTVTYEVDYSALAARSWPAPREAAVADESHFAFVGRSMFVTTPAIGASVVTVTGLSGWRPVVPWPPSATSNSQFTVARKPDLVENLLVVTRSAPEVITAGGLRVSVVTMGHWQGASKDVSHVLRAVIPRLAGLIHDDERSEYLVVLQPLLEAGGESFRHSFAMTADTRPSRANSATWGNLIAHEIFHLWNGWRLVGADYPSSQWFQEGFTEYAANVSMMSSGLTSPDAFLQTLANHVRNYRKLMTSLEESGSHKGPPLYSGGALVAFIWDLQIRHATVGKRNLWSFMNALWTNTEGGRRPYAWPDLQAALESIANLDWERFHTSHLSGPDPLPLAQTFELAGLRLVEESGGAPRVTIDPSAAAASKSLWRALIRGR